MNEKWQPDWDAYFQYNMNDALFSSLICDIFYENCRCELLPQFGSAWENMMHYYFSRPKEAKNAENANLSEHTEG